MCKCSVRCRSSQIVIRISSRTSLGELISYKGGTEEQFLPVTTPLALWAPEASATLRVSSSQRDKRVRFETLGSISNRPSFKASNAKQLKRNGEERRNRTRDRCRDSFAWIGFTTTYKTAGTAKVRGSRARHRILWVRLWVENCLRRWPLCPTFALFYVRWKWTVLDRKSFRFPAIRGYSLTAWLTSQKPTRKEPIRGLDTHLLFALSWAARGRGVCA